MDKLVTALGPAFAAGFAIQQLLELVDQALLVVLGLIPGTKAGYEASKKGVLGLIALGVGLAIAFVAHLQMLRTLGLAGVNPALDAVISGIFISAGTAGFNSVMKFLGYAKEQTKASAQAAAGNSAAASAQAAGQDPVQAQLRAIAAVTRS